MICAGAVSAQFIAGKATRDALFLANIDVTALPMMVILTAAFSIGLVFLTSLALRRMSPATFVPVMFAISAVLLLADWLLAPLAPRLAAQAVYLQISGIGPLLGSGFWLIATERFDPRSARRHFGRLAAVGTLSGLAGAVIADLLASSYGVTATLPFLAAINLLCAWQIRQLAQGTEYPGSEESLQASLELDVGSPRSALRVLADAPYLRNLAALVLLGTVGAALADYLFKVQAVGTLGRGDDLLRFFAIYYAATSLLAFLIQTSASSVALEKLGLATTVSTPAMALLAGGLGAVAFPNLYGITVARGSESVFRGSLFRTGYEIFYTPVPSHEKRAAKSIIDVGFDRLGDAVGGGLIRLLLLLPAARQYVAILAAAIICAMVSLVLARRLNQGYIQTLERSLLHRAIELDLSDVQDLTTRTTMLRTLRGTRGMSVAIEPVSYEKEPTNTAVLADPELQEIIALRSRNRERVLDVLRTDEHLPATLVPHVVPLLAWDPVAEDAVRALRKVAEERVGELIDALLDPNQPFAVRRRLARVFSICVSQRAVDGLLLALDDMRFEVRFQCGRSLAAVLDRNNLVRINRDRIFEVVRREVAVGRPIWEGHRLLDQVDDDQRSFVDEFLKNRAGQSLAHVFTLLSLVLPTDPLKIAYRGLHTDDPRLRGTAVEYLEGVLPPDIRDRLRPFLAEGAVAGPARARDEIVADLLRSNQSIMLNLEELRRREGRTAGPKAARGDRSNIPSKA
jgi:AAA family ATP:ADP antiporter